MEIVAGGLSPAEDGTELVVDGEAAGIIGRGYNALATGKAIDALL